MNFTSQKISYYSKRNGVDFYHICEYHLKPYESIAYNTASEHKSKSEAIEPKVGKSEVTKQEVVKPEEPKPSVEETYVNNFNAIFDNISVAIAQSKGTLVNTAVTSGNPSAPTVVYDAGWLNCITDKMLQKFGENNSVNLQINFEHNHQKYVIVIPAGTDVSKVLGDDMKMCGYLYLAKQLGIPVEVAK